MGNFHRAKGVNQEGAFKLLYSEETKNIGGGKKGSDDETLR